MSNGVSWSEKDVEDFKCELTLGINCVSTEVEKMQFRENGNLEGRKNVCKVGKASISFIREGENMILC